MEPCRPHWAGRGQKQHQAGEQLHLQKAQRGKPHEPDAQVGQAEQPEQLDRLQCQNFSAAGLIRQQTAALLAQNIQLLLPVGAALLPFFRFGQQTHQQRARFCTSGDTHTSTSTTMMAATTAYAMGR